MFRHALVPYQLGKAVWHDIQVKTERILTTKKPDLTELGFHFRGLFAKAGNSERFDYHSTLLYYVKLKSRIAAVTCTLYYFDC